MNDNSPVPQILEYKTTPAGKLSLHVFSRVDSQAAPAPAMLLIHGGGWVNGSPEKMYPLAEKAMRMGCVAVSLQYRLMNDTVTVGDAVEDARDAMIYLRAHAEALNLDPERIVVAGSSAGGHLAAGLVLFPRSGSDTLDARCRPNALILLNPVLDTSPEGYGNAKLGAGWRELSPLHQIRKEMPPILLFHGTADSTVPFSGIRAFHEALTAQGSECEFHPYEGGEHSYYWQEPAYTEVTEQIRRFCTERFGAR